MPLNLPHNTALHIAYSAERYDIVRTLLPADTETPAGGFRVGSYLGDNLIAEDHYAPDDPYAFLLPYDQPWEAHLLLVAGAEFPGLRGTLFAALPIGAAAWAEPEPDVPWKQSVLSPGYPQDPPLGVIERLGFGLVPLGPVCKLIPGQQELTETGEHTQDLLRTITNGLARGVADQLLTHLQLAA